MTFLLERPGWFLFLPLLIEWDAPRRFYEIVSVERTVLVRSRKNSDDGVDTLLSYARNGESLLILFKQTGFYGYAARSLARLMIRR